MFEYAFIEAHGRTARPYTFLVSVAGQCGLIGLSVLLPLMFVDALPQARWLVHLVAPPVQATSVTTEAPLQTGPRQAALRQPADPAKLYEPVRYPPRPAVILDLEEAPPAGAGNASGPGVPFGLGDPNRVLPAAVPSAPHLAAPPPSAPNQEAASTLTTPPLLKVGGKVQAPAPLHTPLPEYPALARQSRVSGVVFLEAIIATDGRIRSLRLIQGHALLSEAAMTAVRSWRYTPPTLNGEPIEILMRLDVNFQLNR